ncbi:MAG: molybdopterin-guanine dinucleotide biosynthesis protein B [Candidatus Bathyarchaeaceae archaeon]
MPVIAVVGSKKSGKTTAIETLVQGLTERGYKVATVKHVPEPDFTIDTKGKDTWRHTKAGARTVISVAPNEIATIKKADTTKYSLEQIIRSCEDDAEIIILEGFRKLIGQNPTVPKIVAVKTVEEALEASKYFKPILTFVGPLPAEATKLKVPHIDVIKEQKRFVDLVDEKVAVQVERKRKRKEELKIQIDEHTLPLNPFVQKFIRNTILGMVSTLKGVAIKGEENISVIIKSLSRHD